ncbi:carbamoyl phosphate synthase small subunit [Tumebacillus algifaecis]|uniref:Carbamoyl phosphate synthase small chain n=1 Tax=Tumebacillus algifaecis TaxID=1214604 RepID=A0A223D310_9BACL|nr:glutamine-hydrolyzing carbamoyl-phosphate synthase small subunit [Tumebacillus algifaecis]ASS75823.1 carbamoyl phosphate synthase small subunit [Tumebacillus algifaecis]
MRARLILEDGTVFEGTAFGAEGESFGEVVFNTGMTGYQEVLTDPSYYGQIVTMTYPLIGNYGVNIDDIESNHPHVRGFVVREWSSHPSNWRNMGSLDAYLKTNNIIGIQGIDTRMLTKKIRVKGTMGGVITTLDRSVEEYVSKLNTQGLLPRDQVARVTTKSTYRSPGKNYRIVAMDFGMKSGVLRSLVARGCDVTVVPADTSAEEILNWQPHGVMLSNGPGDPADLTDIIATVRQLIGQVPIFGICLGHQLISLACGARTERLKFGHRGANHPVKDLLNGRCYITSQNHGYVVVPESLPGTGLELTHINQNDGSVEGVRHTEHPVFSVQYHPEARPGPDDSDYLFDRFMEIIAAHGEGK